MDLLISDTNILIDIEESGLSHRVFSLPYTFSVPDILWHEELRNRHGHLVEMGLQIKELTSQSLKHVEALIKRHPKPSRNDMFALELAMQEGCPLLTGDADLRSTALQEHVIVYGTLWIINLMLEQHVIDIPTAESAYDRMEETGRRLPFGYARQRLKDLKEALDTSI